MSGRHVVMEDDDKTPETLEFVLVPHVERLDDDDVIECSLNEPSTSATAGTMALPKCGACNATGGFQMHTDVFIGGTDKQYNAIVCGKCGAVFNFVEGWHISSALWKIMKKLGVDPNS